MMFVLKVKGHLLFENLSSQVSEVPPVDFSSFEWFAHGTVLIYTVPFY